MAGRYDPRRAADEATVLFDRVHKIGCMILDLFVLIVDGQQREEPAQIGGPIAQAARIRSAECDHRLRAHSTIPDPDLYAEAAQWLRAKRSLRFTRELRRIIPSAHELPLAQDRTCPDSSAATGVGVRLKAVSVWIEREAAVPGRRPPCASGPRARRTAGRGLRTTLPPEPRLWSPCAAACLPGPVRSEHLSIPKRPGMQATPRMLVPTASIRTYLVSRRSPAAGLS